MLEFFNPSFEVPGTAINIYSYYVSCGFPSPAESYIESSLDLNQLCITNPPATFIVRADGDSMISAGIFPHDLLVVDRSLDASSGDIVIATIDGEFTVKYLQKKPVLKLVPANEKYSDLVINEEQDFLVFGVVTNIIRQVRK